MPIFALGLIGVAVLIVLYVIAVYNGLQTLKTQIKASIQEIGNQLKRQATLIPNLEESVKAYMGHEKGIFQMLSDARKSVAAAASSSNPTQIDQAIEKISTLASKISVVVESNPEMKADGTVTKFMDELTDTADKLTYARRAVIDLSQDFNQKLMVFPSNIVAGLFGFQEEKGLEMPPSGTHLSVSDKEMEDVKVSLK